jgi:hypothetical protein
VLPPDLQAAPAHIYCRKARFKKRLWHIVRSEVWLAWLLHFREAKGAFPCELP